MSEIRITPGEHIRDALRRALKMAHESGEAVTFDFNGTPHEVRSDDTYGIAKARAEERVGHEILSRDDEARRSRADLERMKRESREAIEAAAVQTEAELRDSKVPWPESEDAMVEYIRGLVDRPHDYGTCVYAMSMAATAAFQYVAKRLGVTGFQASCADMDILRRTRSLEWGKVLDYSNLLYPQYCDDEHYPPWRSIIEGNRSEFAKRARQKLAESGGIAADGVVKHWRWLASLDSEAA